MPETIPGPAADIGKRERCDPDDTGRPRTIVRYWADRFGGRRYSAWRGISLPDDGPCAGDSRVRKKRPQAGAADETVCPTTLQTGALSWWRRRSACGFHPGSILEM